MWGGRGERNVRGGSHRLLPGHTRSIGAGREASTVALRVCRPEQPPLPEQNAETLSRSTIFRAEHDAAMATSLP